MGSHLVWWSTLPIPSLMLINLKSYGKIVSLLKSYQCLVKSEMSKLDTPNHLPKPHPICSAIKMSLYKYISLWQTKALYSCKRSLWIIGHFEDWSKRPVGYNRFPVEDSLKSKIYFENFLVRSNDITTLRGVTFWFVLLNKSQRSG